MSKKIITISREFGSGGKYIGILVAKKLGIPFYDKDIIEKIAEESGFVDEFIKRVSEYAPSKSIFAYSFIGRNAAGESIEDKIFAIQKRVISELAEKGPCVIVGRSADYILKDKFDTLNVFIYADMKEKIKRTMSFKGVNQKQAEKLIKETDKKRSINYKYYTGQDWGERTNYMLMLNSTELGVEKTADFIAEIYKKETEKE
ncbi:MAG: cytidylate kinase-like family protein [Clostridia bacterium]|nr:cytidylate kinase-like family protein [Clostridia bacterium]